MVDLQGLLEPVHGQGPVAEDATRVVGEHVDPLERGEVRGQRTDVVEPGEVRYVVLHAQLGRHRARLRRSPHDDDAVAVRVQAAGGGGPDSVTGARDDDCPYRFSFGVGPRHSS